MSKGEVKRTKPNGKIRSIGHGEHRKTTLTEDITKGLALKGQAQERE